MSGIEQTANDLFFKLRNRFPRISMGDADGSATNDPTESKFFNFDFELDSIKFGNITASLSDGVNLKLFYSQDITEYMDRDEKLQWYKFLQEIRKFAKSHMLGLDVRDISKDTLSQKDLQFVSNQTKENNQLGESRVLWTRRGKVSEGDVNNVKVHVVHSERMDENPNNRLLRVDRIFLVNESGERFLLPFKSVVAAKAMANYVSRGGNPYDNSGRLISDAVMEMSNLRRFASATRRKTFESEEATKVIEAAQIIKESIKRSLFRMANNSRFDENLQDLNKIMAEQTDVDDIKPLFVQSVYNENLDNWMTSAAKAYKQYQGNIMEALKETAGAVSAKLRDPKFQLVLKDEPSEDRLIATSKYADGKALLRRVLGTIADRLSLDNSDVANWASQIGQDMEDNKASNEDMQLALQLAKRYQEDLKKMSQDPEYSKEVRTSSFGTRRTLAPRAKSESSEFESWVTTLGEEEIQSSEEEMMDEIAADEEGMDMTIESEVEETALDRVRARAASRSNHSESDMEEDGDADDVGLKIAQAVGGTAGAMAGTELGPFGVAAGAVTGAELGKRAYTAAKPYVKSAADTVSDYGNRAWNSTKKTLGFEELEELDKEEELDEVEDCGCGDETDGSMSPMSMANQTDQSQQIAIVPVDALAQILKMAGMR